MKCLLFVTFTGTALAGSLFYRILPLHSPSLFAVTQLYIIIHTSLQTHPFLRAHCYSGRGLSSGVGAARGHQWHLMTI